MESLEELRKLKNRGKSEQIRLRQEFKDLCNKTREACTREMAIREVQQLLNRNKTTENLRLWVSVLTEKGELHPEEVLVIGYVAKVYGRRLLDPLDKTPSLAKTSFRLL
jgi:hypothetical protein